MTKIKNTWNKIKKFLHINKKDSIYNKTFKKAKKPLTYEENFEKLNNEIINILKKLVEDWSKNRYSIKVKTEDYLGSIKFIYIFDNGNVLELHGYDLSYKNYKTLLKHSYTLNDILKNNINEIVNTIIEQINSKYKSKQTIEDPKQIKYNLLLNNIKLRQYKLNLVLKDDKSRINLENELNVVKRKAKLLKEKYNLY